MPTIAKTHEMISEILGVIFQAEYRRLGQWIDRLVQQNRRAYEQTDLQGFIYNGVIYKETQQTVPDHLLNRRGLHHTLSSAMDAYLVDLTTLNRDKAFISQALAMLLDPCKTIQDIRDALPECLADTLGCISGRPRGDRPEAFTLDDNPRAKRQYEKILPRIQMYAVTRLIY
jgi:hypothetical protein